MRNDETRGQDQAATHDHGSRSEQEARIAGEHGWGYGGRPASTIGADATTSAAPKASVRPDDALPDDPKPHDVLPGGVESAATESSSSPPSPSIPESAADPAPLDSDGHHPDWRR